VSDLWLGKPGTPVGLIRRHRERRRDKHASILYPTESGEKTVLRPSTVRQTPVTKSFSTKNNTACAMWFIVCLHKKAIDFFSFDVPAA
jgi:hypothetical protein